MLIMKNIIVKHFITMIKINQNNVKFVMKLSNVKTKKKLKFLN